MLKRTESNHISRMPFDTRSVPFEIPNVSHGFQKAGGLLKLEDEDERLVLEFEVEDALFGVFKSGVREAILPLRKLQSVEFKKGWFSSKVILEANSLRVFEGIPGASQGECTLKIKRENRKEAEKLISKVRLILSELKLKDLDAES